MMLFSQYIGLAACSYKQGHRSKSVGFIDLNLTAAPSHGVSEYILMHLWCLLRQRAATEKSHTPRCRRRRREVSDSAYQHTYRAHPRIYTILSSYTRGAIAGDLSRHFYAMVARGINASIILSLESAASSSSASAARVSTGNNLFTAFSQYYSLSHIYIYIYI